MGFFFFYTSFTHKIAGAPTFYFLYSVFSFISKKEKTKGKRKWWGKEMKEEGEKEKKRKTK